MIQFIKDPPGKFRSQFKVGGTARFDKARERILIQKGFAVEINQETIESNTWGLQPDDSTASPRKARTKNRKQ